jgi:ABC-type lipoprotein release transport system permease subunit
MKLTFVLAYRNLFRNSRRTILASLLLGCSLAALIFTDGVMQGMMELLIETASKTMTGEAQIRRKGFLNSTNTDLYMSNVSEIESFLENDEHIAGYATRTRSGGMISSSYNRTGGLIFGVSPEMELSVGKLRDAIVEGDYLTGQDSEILVGVELAELLEIKLGDRIVLTTSEVDGGDLSQALFKLSGIFNFGIKQLDASMVFISLARSREMLGMDDSAHEIVVQFSGADDHQNLDLPIYKKFNTAQLETLGWLESAPQIASMLTFIDFSAFLIGLILFFVAAIGIINSIFMSIYERIYEFGVIKALGTEPKRIFQLIVCEAFLLAILGLIFGLIIGIPIIWYYSVHGIPLGDLQFQGLTIADKIKTVITPTQFTIFPLWMIGLTLVASIYPAIFAAKIIPSEALKKTL